MKDLPNGFNFKEIFSKKYKNYKFFLKICKVERDFPYRELFETRNIETYANERNIRNMYFTFFTCPTYNRYEREHFVTQE